MSHAHIVDIDFVCSSALKFQILHFKLSFRMFTCRSISRVEFSLPYAHQNLPVEIRSLYAACTSNTHIPFEFLDSRLVWHILESNMLEYQLIACQIIVCHSLAVACSHAVMLRACRIIRLTLFTGAIDRVSIHPETGSDLFHYGRHRITRLGTPWGSGRGECYGV